MEKLLKTPLFVIRLIDAFILRLPLASLVVVGVANFILGEGEIQSKADIFLTFVLIFAFALVQAFLYVVIYPRRTPAQKTLARVCEVLFSLILIFGIAMPVLQEKMITEANTLVFTLPVLIKAFAENPFILIIFAWVFYVIISERIKGKKDKERRKKVPASQDPTFRTFSEISCVHNALMNLGRAQDDKRFNDLMRSSDELLKSIEDNKRKKASAAPKTQQARKPQTKNVRISSGNRVGVPFFDSDAMKEYKKYILSNHVVICVSGNSAFVVKLIEKKGDYRQGEDCWYRNESRTSDYTAELGSIIHVLKSKCGIPQARGVMAKAFAGGSITADNSYEVLDVSRSYDVLEKEIKAFMPAENADKQLTETCAKAVKREFGNRFAVEKKEVR